MKRIKGCFSCDEFFEKKKSQLVNEPTELFLYDWGISLAINTYRDVTSGAYFIEHGDMFKERLGEKLDAMYRDKFGEVSDIEELDDFRSCPVVELEYQWIQECSSVLSELFAFINSDHLSVGGFIFSPRTLLDMIRCICEEVKASKDGQMVMQDGTKVDARTLHQWWREGYLLATGVTSDERRKELIDLYEFDPDTYSPKRFEALCEIMEKRSTSFTKEIENKYRRMDLQVLKTFARKGDVDYCDGAEFFLLSEKDLM